MVILIPLGLKSCHQKNQDHLAFGLNSFQLHVEKVVLSQRNSQSESWSSFWRVLILSPVPHKGADAVPSSSQRSAAVTDRRDKKDKNQTHTQPTAHTKPTTQQPPKPQPCSGKAVHLYSPGPKPEQIARVLYPRPARLERKQQSPSVWQFWADRGARGVPAALPRGGRSRSAQRGRSWGQSSREPFTSPAGSQDAPLGNAAPCHNNDSFCKTPINALQSLQKSTSVFNELGLKLVIHVWIKWLFSWSCLKLNLVISTLKAMSKESLLFNQL